LLHLPAGTSANRDAFGGSAFNAAWQRSMLQQPKLTCQLLEAVTRSCSSIALQRNSDMAKQAVLTAQQLLQAVADMFAQDLAHASELRAGVERSREVAQQLFLFVVSQLKLLRGFYRMHGSSSSLGLMLEGWRSLGWVRTALQCTLAAAGPAGRQVDDSSSSSCVRGLGSSSSSSSSSSKVQAVAELWPFATALALRDASEVLQLLLQGHGLPPTHRADVLAETLQSCSDAVLRLSKVRRMHSALVLAAPVAGDAAAPPQSHKDAALGGALRACGSCCSGSCCTGSAEGSSSSSRWELATEELFS
jgi:hypothetical protein